MTRKLRADQTEVTMMVSQLCNPPQGENFRPLVGEIFPQEYPFAFDQIFNYHYFWLKYYVSQRTYFAIPKRPMYVNYEALTQAFSSQIIDYSEAEIYELQNESMSEQELEKLLSLQN